MSQASHCMGKFLFKIQTCRRTRRHGHQYGESRAVFTQLQDPSAVTRLGREMICIMVLANRQSPVSSRQSAAGRNLQPPTSNLQPPTSIQPSTFNHYLFNHIPKPPNILKSIVQWYGSHPNHVWFPPVSDNATTDHSIKQDFSSLQHQH